MSTLYAINAETSTSVAGLDYTAVYRTSDGRTYKAAMQDIRTYILGVTSGQTLGFFGATAISQPTSVDQAAVASTAAVSAASTPWGYTTSTQANAIITLLNRMRLDLVALGLIKGS